MSIVRMATELLPSRRPVTVRAAAAAPGAQADAKVLALLTRFIPTEILAPYAAAMSLVATYKWDAVSVYVSFIVAAPVALALFTYAAKATAREPWPALPPLIWRCAAAAIAFAVWATAVPGNPLQSTVIGPALAGFLAMIVSPVLDAIDRIVMRILESPPKDPVPAQPRPPVQTPNPNPPVAGYGPAQPPAGQQLQGLPGK